MTDVIKTVKIKTDRHPWLPTWSFNQGIKEMYVGKVTAGDICHVLLDQYNHKILSLLCATNVIVVVFVVVVVVVMAEGAA